MRVRVRATRNTASAAARTIAPRRPLPARLLLMMNSNADRTYSSLIAMRDWLVMAMVETADPRSHRGDPPVFPSHHGRASTRTRKETCTDQEPQSASDRGCTGVEAVPRFFGA